ncbi:MAG: FxsA family protein, partial [Nocardioides sp.]
GTLLLTPGFITDLVGAFAVLPFTRSFARSLLTRVITRKFAAGAGFPDPTTRQRPGTDESVVRGEVIND